jgi:hypothetical protein
MDIRLPHLLLQRFGHPAHAHGTELIDRWLV